MGLGCIQWAVLITPLVSGATVKIQGCFHLRVRVITAVQFGGSVSGSYTFSICITPSLLVYPLHVQQVMLSTTVHPGVLR